ncbi:cobalt/nickel transport system permease protein [Rhizobium sp. RU20A]|uniref:energy-coupling factor transporter transmembrane component T family protein n=1 Tax=Rhizobium sp. RU20A TaxID=1907412 RepID=UPI000954C2B3|nr:CbiQ family ECF transporter T component [Rhizobium sp. RU20A]SIQ36192.1 cobalt/nickel transport system permease protein [Rhizobium sp. RU20A]
MRDIDRIAQTGRWRGVAAGEKLLFSIGCMGLSLAFHGVAAQGVLLATVLSVTFAGARVRVGEFIGAARVPALFILVGTLAQAVSLSTGPSYLALAPPEALAAAGFAALRSATCVSALLFLALTTPLTAILHFLQRLGLNRDISDIALVMFRIIWLALDCLQSGQRSLAGRLGDVGARRRIRSGGLLLAALLPRVLDRAGRLDRGLAARGYDGQLVFLSTEAAARPQRLGAIAAGLVLAGLVCGVLL